MDGGTFTNGILFLMEPDTYIEHSAGRGEERCCEFVGSAEFISTPRLFRHLFTQIKVPSVRALTSWCRFNMNESR